MSSTSSDSGTNTCRTKWTKPQYRDIALRDLGLALGALALARLPQDAPEEATTAAMARA